MSDRRIILVHEKDEPTTLPFWDRHFASMLAVVGAVIAAFFAISDNALSFFVNQPPEVEIRLSKQSTELGDRIYARGEVTDPGGDTKEIEFKWELFEADTILTQGIGIEYDRVTLPTAQAGTFTVLVTVTDERGEGKYARNEAVYIVSERSVAASEAIVPKQVDPPPTQNESVEYLSEIVLTDDSRINWNKKQASRVITNGFDLIITGDSIASNLEILSFTKPASPGNSGATGSSGRTGGSQQDGFPGDEGGNGEPGKAGGNSGTIRIEVVNIDADLTVTNDGQVGGDGGNGGHGGRGGTGGQGRPASSSGFDCSRGPGRGGSGGNGGNGGNGGYGGDGGYAGSVEIVVSGSIRGDLNVRAKGGRPGVPGQAGLGGPSGSGGREGRTSGWCRPAGRTGPAGKPGVSGRSGSAGAAGADGGIVVEVSGDTIRSEGLYKN